MGSTTRLRVLFLAMVIAAQAHEAAAEESPSWFEDCTSYCNLDLLVYECVFEDQGNGHELDASSVCQPYPDCQFVWCTGATEYAIAEPGSNPGRYPEYCTSLAPGAGVTHV